MAPEVTVALVAAVPALVAAVGAWRTNGYKLLSTQVTRIEKKLDRHITWHLGENTNE